MSHIAARLVEWNCREKLSLLLSFVWWALETLRDKMQSVGWFLLTSQVFESFSTIFYFLIFHWSHNSFRTLITMFWNFKAKTLTAHFSRFSWTEKSFLSFSKTSLSFPSYTKLAHRSTNSTTNFKRHKSAQVWLNFPFLSYMVWMFIAHLHLKIEFCL